MDANRFRMTARVFRIDFDLAHFAPLMIDGDDAIFRSWQPMIEFDGTPRQATWASPPLYVENPLEPRPNFSMLVGSASIVMERVALDAVRPHLLGVGELLQARVRDEELWIANVTNVVDCLDISLSRTDEFGIIRGYSFQEHRLPEATVFKIPQTAALEIMAVEHGEHRGFEFKATVEDLHLSGLRFTELWNSNLGSVDVPFSPFGDA